MITDELQDGVHEPSQRLKDECLAARNSAGRGAATVTLSFFVLAMLFCVGSAALAQTEGRVSIGVSATHYRTTDRDVAPSTTAGPLVRLNPHKGWGPAGAFNWFRADLKNPSGTGDDFAHLHVRPLMGGVSYSVSRERVLTSFSIVGGPSFNKAEFDGSFVPVPGESIHASLSIAVRPGVGVTWTVGPRVAIVGFGGYVINRPEVVYRSRFAQEFRDWSNADAVIVSIGIVYSLF